MKNYKIYLTALAALIVAGVFIFGFVHIKTEGKIAAANSEIQSGKQEIEKIRKFREAHKNLEEDMRELAKRHFRAAEMFPKRIDEEKTVEFLRESAVENGLYIAALSADKEKLDEDETSFAKKFTLKANGDYFNILDYLKKLSTSRDFYDIRRMNLDNDNGEITLRLDIITYCAESDDKG